MTEEEKGFERVFRYAQVGHCVSGVVHDINNYLGAIQVNVDVIKMAGRFDDESQRMLDNIKRAIAQCNALFSSLSSITSKEHSGISVIVADTFIKETVALKRYDYKEARVTLEVVMPETLPTITGDLPRLRLALLYLLENALENAERTGVKQVRLKASSESGHFRFEVRNASPPLTESDRETLFSPFYTPKGGSRGGFGLTLARETARAHGGDLFYDPAKGFVMELPLGVHLEPSFLDHNSTGVKV